MKERQVDAELRQLVDGMLGGRLSRVEVARLEERMEEDPWAMDYYLSLAEQDVLMAEVLGELSEEENVEPNVRRFPVVLGLVAALTVIAGLSLFLLNDVGNTRGLVLESNVEVGATITSEVGAAWEGNALVVGSRLQKGSVVALSGGLAELTHESGVRLLLEGPASYEVEGPNAGKLEYGKVVAEVPPGAEGFTIQYLDGKVVDFGTEFAISAPLGAKSAEVGVFRGEVRVQQENDTIEGATPLYTGHAVRMAEATETGLLSIPFDQRKYVRTMPSRELPWFDRGTGEPIEWDVSHLVWSAGEYLGVIKWMNGEEALVLSGMELLLDGEVVSRDVHVCSVGEIRSTVENIYRFEVKSEEWRKGRWTLRAWPEENREGGLRDGILMFESGASLAVTPSDFTGSWKYVHDGNRYLRKFYGDGSCALWINGVPSNYFEGAEWTVEGGIMRVFFPTSDITEDHMLRDGDSMLFINQPYRNGRRKQ